MKRTAFFFSLLCLSCHLSCGGATAPGKKTRKFPHLEVDIPSYYYDIYGGLIITVIEKMPKPARDLRLGASPAHASRMIESPLPAEIVRIFPPSYTAPYEVLPHEILKAVPAKPIPSICEMLTAIFCYSGLKND